MDVDEVRVKELGLGSPHSSFTHREPEEYGWPEAGVRVSESFNQTLGRESSGVRGRKRRGTGLVYCEKWPFSIGLDSTEALQWRRKCEWERRRDSRRETDNKQTDAQLTHANNHMASRNFSAQHSFPHTHSLFVCYCTLIEINTTRWHYVRSKSTLATACSQWGKGIKTDLLIASGYSKPVFACKHCKLVLILFQIINKK